MFCKKILNWIYMNIVVWNQLVFRSPSVHPCIHALVQDIIILIAKPFISDERTNAENIWSQLHPRSSCIFKFITTLLAPSIFFTSSMYFTSVTLDDRILSFSPAQSNCKHLAFSRNSVIRNSLNKSFWAAVVGDPPDGTSCEHEMNVGYFDFCVHDWIKSLLLLPVSRACPSI